MSTSIASMRVRDAMNHGIVSCDADAPTELLAQIMAEQRVHAIVVRDVADDRRPLGIVSALDIASAVAKGGDLTAAETCTGPVITVSADDTVQRAALLMTEHDVGHLVVIDQAGPKPVGIISSLDIARVHGR